MSIKGRCWITLSDNTRKRLQNCDTWPDVTYDYVINNMFHKCDELKAENTELKRKLQQIDNIQESISTLATGLVGKINGNK